MGKSSGSPPPQPDPYAVAAAQGAQNREAAITSGELSMINQATPWGSLTFNQIADSESGNPRYEAVQSLSPAQQALLAGNEALDQQMLDVANTQLGRVSGSLGEPLSFDGLPQQVTNLSPDVLERQRVEEALMGRLDPYLERDRAALEARLANQGIGMGSEAWNRGMDDFARSSTDARLGVIGAAGDEQNRLYSLAMQDAALQNTGRQQGIQEQMLLRQTPINEVSALVSGAQVAPPQFVNTPQFNVQPSDLMGAVYGSANLANQNYQSQLAQNAAFNQGLFGLLGTGLGAGAYAFGGGR